MFKCKGCEALKVENQRLHEMIERLLDKIAGPVIPLEVESVQRPPMPDGHTIDEDGVERNNEGKVVAEHFTYGVE